MRLGLTMFGLVAALAACSPPSQQGDVEAAHEAYVAAINSNDAETLMGVLTEDVVYLPPHEPAVVGQAAVRPWSEAYFAAFRTNWVKTTDEFIVSGDWAIERYSYVSTDTPVAGGDPIRDTGKGINIYHHDADGVWRIARDAWNSDAPLSN